MIRKIATTVKKSLNDLFDCYWDNKLGIRTRGVHPSATASKFGDNVECNPTGYRLLLKVLDSLPDNLESEVFIDYGCGKGRVICLSAQMPFKKIIGVEISEAWADHSARNVDSMHSKKAREISVIIDDAVNFDPVEGTIFYFFNPFGPETFKAVLDRLRDSVERNPRRISIIYYNTVCKYVIDQESWLQRRQVIHRDLHGHPAIIAYSNHPSETA